MKGTKEEKNCNKERTFRRIRSGKIGVCLRATLAVISKSETL
jgi:hypothetical protein